MKIREKNIIEKTKDWIKNDIILRRENLSYKEKLELLEKKLAQVS